MIKKKSGVKIDLLIKLFIVIILLNAIITVYNQI